MLQTKKQLENNGATGSFPDLMSKTSIANGLSVVFVDASDVEGLAYFSSSSWVDVVGEFVVTFQLNRKHITKNSKVCCVLHTFCNSYKNRKGLNLYMI